MSSMEPTWTVTWQQDPTTNRSIRSFWFGGQFRKRFAAIVAVTSSIILGPRVDYVWHEEHRVGAKGIPCANGRNHEYTRCRRLFDRWPEQRYRQRVSNGHRGRRRWGSYDRRNGHSRRDRHVASVSHEQRPYEEPADRFIRCNSRHNHPGDRILTWRLRCRASSPDQPGQRKLAAPDRDDR
jgi:hypothetical protein